MTHGLTFDETGPTWFALPAQLERERHANVKLTAELEKVRAENRRLRSDLVSLANDVAPASIVAAQAGMDIGCLAVIDPSWLTDEAEAMVWQYAGRGLCTVITSSDGDGFSPVEQWPDGLVVISPPRTSGAMEILTGPELAFMAGLRGVTL